MCADELDDLIERTRAWTPRDIPDQERRRAQRRKAERRTASHAARRAEDGERNLAQRRFLFSYLQTLPFDELWLWIDGLWLGQATDAQLAALEQCVAHSADNNAPKKPQLVGRPRLPADSVISGLDPINSSALRAEWADLTLQLHAFSQHREKHHAPMNRTRRGKPISLESRTASLNSLVGQRVHQAELFEKFFEDRELIPTEMAAKLLHHEIRARLTNFATYARARAKSAKSDDSREWWSIEALRATRRLKCLGSSTTLYKKLRATRAQVLRRALARPKTHKS